MIANRTLSGFTLIELLMVVSILGIVSAYALIKSVSFSAVTLPSQAQKMASDLRHAQALASAWGVSLTVTVTAGTNGSYAVTCTSGSSTPPCNGSSAITDPATGTSFSTTLQKDVVLSGSPTTLAFSSLGEPWSGGQRTSASYQLSYGSSSSTVSVAALSGRISVQ